MSTGWSARFLGGFSLERGEARIERLRSQKTIALLYALHAGPPRTFSRDELIARFWPDDPLESAQDSLRVALSNLRLTLGAARLSRHAPISGSPTAS